jgi:hypothetical protein
MNTDRHAGNILVSGGREQSRSWVYFIDHGFAFGGVVPEQQLAAETERSSILHPVSGILPKSAAAKTPRG